MNRFIIMLLLVFAINNLSAQNKIKKAIFIIADGIPADVIKKLNLPNFKKIAHQGGFAKALVGGEKGAYSQTPTISAVGYNSILTGTWVNKHNVWDNDIAAPNYYYPTIFRLLKTQSPGKKIGIFSSWQDNRTKLVGDGMSETGSIYFDYKFDGLELDTINYPHDKKSDFMHRIDESVTNEAAKTIRENAPDLSWLYLEYTDDMGHMHGDSPEFYKAIGYMDEQVGRILNAIEYRQQNFNEDWLIVVTTDHGRDSATGRNHGGQSAREKGGWILTNGKGLNDRFIKQQSSIVDIMPTIARFMEISIPLDVAREVDGVPLIGKLSIVEPSIDPGTQQAIIKWKGGNKKEKVKIWLTTTNNFKTGGKDEYQFLKEVPSGSQQAVIDLKNIPSAFYKIVLEGENNSINRWIVKDAK
ncbi:MAG: alkaline phosphatase family protein [Chitinophagaceae bacterium]